MLKSASQCLRMGIFEEYPGYTDTQCKTTTYQKTYKKLTPIVEATRINSVEYVTNPEHKRNHGYKTITHQPYSNK